MFIIGKKSCYFISGISIYRNIFDQVTFNFDKPKLFLGENIHKEVVKYMMIGHVFLQIRNNEHVNYS